MIFKIEYSNLTKRWYVVMMETKIVGVNSKETAEKVVDLLNKDRLIRTPKKYQELKKEKNNE